MVRSEKSEHLECHCPKRMVDCIYCDESMHWDQVQEHHDLCPKKPIPCILCEREVQRDKMAEHASTDCPKVKIECIYAKVGCSFKVGFGWNKHTLKTIPCNNKVLYSVKGLCWMIT
eukprot:m.244964 g.244964  ORF g.244964 m.244964 type:complete len:116 (+) comp40249_c0_seq55:586-933(+)